MLMKKNYKAIAEIVDKYNAIQMDYYDFGNFVSDLATYFKEDNPNFDREKFLTACGFGDE